MKADELMIGNYYNEFGIPKQVTAEFMLKLDNIQKCKKIAIDVSPIPLTEEWLLKFGFEYSGGEGYLMPCGEYIYASLRNGYMLDAHKNHDFKGIHYVHQLQNLYFALTQEKLTIK